ncbi:unnamed protein product [Adineta ricciae]|nr:unnamed protein product [Adineta ricciae]
MGCAPQSGIIPEGKVSKVSNCGEGRIATDSNNFRSNASRPLVAQIDRFTASSLEWTLSGFDGVLKLAQITSNLPKCSINETVEKIQAAKELEGGCEMDKVNEELNRASANNSIDSLLRAYTIESDFYKTLNKNLAKCLNPLEIGEFFHVAASVAMGTHVKLDVDWPLYFVSSIWHYVNTPNRSRNQFIGRTYRGMKITKEDFASYRINSFIIQKTFTSTSKQRLTAESFMGENELGKVSALCTYVLDSPTTNYSIDLQDISIYPDEEEVLIPPIATFKITRIVQNTKTGVYEIELSLITDKRAEDLNVGLEDWEPDDKTVDDIMHALFAMRSGK